MRGCAAHTAKRRSRGRLARSSCRTGAGRPWPGRATRSAATLNMSIEEAMRTQRVIDRFKPDPVGDRLLLQLVELIELGREGTVQRGTVAVRVRPRGGPRGHRGACSCERSRVVGVRQRVAMVRARRCNAPPHEVEAVALLAGDCEDVHAVIVACGRPKHDGADREQHEKQRPARICVKRHFGAPGGARRPARACQLDVWLDPSG